MIRLRINYSFSMSQHGPNFRSTSILSLSPTNQATITPSVIKPTKHLKICLMTQLKWKSLKILLHSSTIKQVIKWSIGGTLAISILRRCTREPSNSSMRVRFQKSPLGTQTKVQQRPLSTFIWQEIIAGRWMKLMAASTSYFAVKCGSVIPSCRLASSIASLRKAQSISR